MTHKNTCTSFLSEALSGKLHKDPLTKNRHLLIWLHRNTPQQGAVRKPQEQILTLRLALASFLTNGWWQLIRVNLNWGIAFTRLAFGSFLLHFLNWWSVWELQAHCGQVIITLCWKERTLTRHREKVSDSMPLCPWHQFLSFSLELGFRPWVPQMMNCNTYIYVP